MNQEKVDNRPQARLAFDRHEQKFPLAASLWRQANVCAEGYIPIERFDGVHHIVNICTIYLDSPELRSYREYLSGAPLRTKVRLRQYGYEGKINGECWAEIKTKRYGFSTKRRFRGRLKEITEMLEGRDITEHVMQFNPDNSEVLHTYRAMRDMIAGHKLRPLLRVDYERVAYQVPDKRIRLTLDRKLRFRTFRGKTATYSGLVLEAKYLEQKPDWLPDLLRDLGLDESARFSKYARAVRGLGLADAV